MNLREFKKLNNDVSLSDREFEFVKQSNYIEAEYGTKTLSDAIHAWDYVRNRPKFDLHLILHCHHILMVDIDSSIAGKIRDQSVTIGGGLKPFISTQLIIDDIIFLCMRINDGKVGPKEAHIQFEYIHPFVDGNGRVGRMLYNAHRLQIGEPIHIIQESEKGAYYEWF
jgi:Fic family protein